MARKTWENSWVGEPLVFSLVIYLPLEINSTLVSGCYDIQTRTTTVVANLIYLEGLGPFSTIGNSGSHTRVQGQPSTKSECYLPVKYSFKDSLCVLNGG